jgi:hypothetical protein
MSRNETLILVKNPPSTVVDGLDLVFGAQDYRRTILRTIDEDFTPLLNEQGGPVICVLSPPENDWVACWTSLSVDDEWEIAASLAQAIQEPVLCAVLSAEQGMYVYRYWENGDLREEALAASPDEEPLDETKLLACLERHGIPATLIDDRVDGVGREHIVLGYQSME